jgi:hypothetical protein
MARQLKNFQFPEPTEYDWNRWTDTHAWEIVQGEDYSVSTESMRTNLYDKARQLKRSVRTQAIRTKDGREGLRFQFFHPDAAQSPARRARARDRQFPVSDPRRFK